MERCPADAESLWVRTTESEVGAFLPKILVYAAPILMVQKSIMICGTAAVNRIYDSHSRVPFTLMDFVSLPPLIAFLNLDTSLRSGIALAL